MRYLIIFLPLLLLAGCNDSSDSLADTDGLEEPPGSNTPDPNDGNLAIYDVDEDDPYKIANGEFLGLRPGGSLAEHKEGLREGELKNGSGTFNVYYIDSAEGDELGYVLPDPRDPGAIRSIVITSTNVVTEKGVRVGIEFDELQQRVPGISVGGSEAESRVFATDGQLRYRMSMASTQARISADKIPAKTDVTEIWLSN